MRSEQRVLKRRIGLTKKYKKKTNVIIFGNQRNLNQNNSESYSNQNGEVQKTTRKDREDMAEKESTFTIGVIAPIVQISICTILVYIANQYMHSLQK